MHFFRDQNFPLRDIALDMTDSATEISERAEYPDSERSSLYFLPLLGAFRRDDKVWYFLPLGLRAVGLPRALYPPPLGDKDEFSGILPNEDCLVPIAQQNKECV